MTKEADEDVAEQAAAQGKVRRGRRSKGGGLRVPSDNVPRAPDSSNSELSAPVPADPNLAVSVAYAFGADDSGAHRRITAPDVEAQQTGPDTPGSLPVPHGNDVSDDSQTREMPAVQLEALGLSEDMLRDDDEPLAGNRSGDSVDIPFDDEELPEQMATIGAAQPMRVQRAATVALSDEDLEELMEPFEDARSNRSRTTSEDAKDIADPVQLDSAFARGEMDGRSTEPLPAILDEAGDGSVDGDGLDGAATATATPDDADGSAAGDEDYEDYEAADVADDDDANDAEHEDSAAAADDANDADDENDADENNADIAATVARDATADVDDDADADAADAADVADADAAADDADDAEPIADEDFEVLPISADEHGEVQPAQPAAGPERGLAAAVAGSGRMRAQFDDESSAVQHADAGDSGEIITDDLIEEVDDRVKTLPPPTPVVPPPAPATTERTPPRASKKAPPPAPKPGGARAAAVAAAAQPSKPRRRKGKPWFEELFDEDYLRTLPFLTPQATQAEALFVQNALEVDAGAQVLDVGCGYGRHAMELAARGYHVVALDSSLPLLLRGADEAQRRSLNINFVHGDMRELTFESQFDGAYCLFSTFGYFDDDTNKKAAQNIARALKPGARLVIAVLNRDYLIEDLPSRVWWEGDGCVVLEEVEFNYFSSRIISNRSVVFDDGRQLEQEISMRAYALHEFGKLLHAAGFRVLEVSGSMVTRGRFFGVHSREIIVVAERRAEKPGRAPTNLG